MGFSYWARQTLDAVAIDTVNGALRLPTILHSE